jgi:hypothetical protein
MDPAKLELMKMYEEQARAKKAKKAAEQVRTAEKIPKIPSGLVTAKNIKHAFGTYGTFAVAGLDLLASQNKTPALFGIGGAIGAGFLLRKSPWWTKLLGKTIGYASGRFLGSALTTAHTPEIEGLGHGGVAEQRRRVYTDFGSGYQREDENSSGWLAIAGAGLLAAVGIGAAGYGLSRLAKSSGGSISAAITSAGAAAKKTVGNTYGSISNKLSRVRTRTSAPAPKSVSYSNLDSVSRNHFALQANTNLRKALRQIPLETAQSSLEDIVAMSYDPLDIKRAEWLTKKVKERSFTSSELESIGVDYLKRRNVPVVSTEKEFKEQFVKVFNSTPKLAEEEFKRASKALGKHYGDIHDRNLVVRWDRTYDSPINITKGSIKTQTLYHETAEYLARDSEFSVGPILGHANPYEVLQTEFATGFLLNKKEREAWFDNFLWAQGRHQSRAIKDVQSVLDKSTVVPRKRADSLFNDIEFMYDYGDNLNEWSKKLGFKLSGKRKKIIKGIKKNSIELEERLSRSLEITHSGEQIEGLRHDGIASLVRAAITDFGSGYLRTVLRLGGATAKELQKGFLGAKRMLQVSRSYLEGQGIKVVYGRKALAKELLKRSPGKTKEQAFEFATKVAETSAAATLPKTGIVYMPSHKKLRRQLYGGSRLELLLKGKFRKAFASTKQMEAQLLTHEAVEHRLHQVSKPAWSKIAGHESSAIFMPDLEAATMIGPQAVLQTLHARKGQIKQSLESTTRKIEEGIQKHIKKGAMAVFGGKKPIGAKERVLAADLRQFSRKSGEMLEKAGYTAPKFMQQVNEMRESVDDILIDHANKVRESLMTTQLSSTKRILRKYHANTIRGISEQGLSGEANKGHGFHSGWDPLRRFIGKLGSTFNDVRGSKHFQRALEKGRKVRDIGSGGAGDVALMETELPRQVLGHSEEFVGPMPGLQYVKKTYKTDIGGYAKAEQLREAEIMGLEVLEGNIGPTPYHVSSPTSKSPALYMEYIGESTTLDKFAKTGQKLNKSQVQSLENAVQEMHKQGLAHSDITTKNVMVSNTGQVSLLDPMPYRFASSADTEHAMNRVRQSQDKFAIDRIKEWTNSKDHAKQASASLTLDLWGMSNAPGLAGATLKQAEAAGIDPKHYLASQYAGQKLYGTKLSDEVISAGANKPVVHSSEAQTVVTQATPIKIPIENKRRMQLKRKQSSSHVMAAHQANAGMHKSSNNSRRMSQANNMFEENPIYAAYDETLLDPLGERRSNWERYRRSGR